MIYRLVLEHNGGAEIEEVVRGPLEDVEEDFMAADGVQGLHAAHHGRRHFRSTFAAHDHVRSEWQTELCAVSSALTSGTRNNDWKISFGGIMVLVETSMRFELVLSAPGGGGSIVLVQLLLVIYRLDWLSCVYLLYLRSWDV